MYKDNKNIGYIQMFNTLIYSKFHLCFVSFHQFYFLWNVMINPRKNV